MMRVIEELQHKLEVAKGALEKYAEPKKIVPNGVAKNALAEIEGVVDANKS